ncbi:MAG: uracil-DNA glycosylase family protein [Planctomycetales bacterium]
MDRPQRIALQHLESLRRAGVRGLRRSAVGGPTGPAVPVAGPNPPRRADSAERRPSPPVPEPSRPAERPAAALPAAAHSPAHSEPSAVPARPKFDVPSDPASLAPDDRRAALAAVCDAVKGCRLCRELAETRTQTVFGVGNAEAKILFVGEAPGADEDRQGEPFVGRAGQLLNDIITACRLTREEIYICNILKCRPPGNRNPSDAEAANCREFLEAQIKIVDPDYIVCWGAIATRNLLGKTESVGKLRGRFFQYGRAKVLCTYHPSYLLRNPSSKKDVWEDMKFFRRDMGVVL